MSDLFVEELAGLLQDPVLDGTLARGLYATDASHYQITPRAVAHPRSEEEVVAAVECAGRHAVALTPRGSATSLSGQTHGPGLILDVSRHMDALLELNVEEGWARVQPGLIRDSLNKAAAAHGLQFAPDPATSSRASLGGMLGNNSSGTRSILYGITSDHVLAARVVLADGRALALKPRLFSEWAEDDAGDLLRGLKEVVDANRDEIQKRFPTVMRRVSGYALDAFLEDPAEQPWNLARLLCGSEGSLGIVTEITVKLVPLPKHTGLLALHFPSMGDALRAVEPMLQFQPSAIELLDATVLREAQRNASTKELADFIEGDPEAMLLTEFFGENEEDISSRAQALISELGEQVSAAPFFSDPAAQARCWDVRRLGLGLITNVKGSCKGQAFIEDACIPLPHLPTYIEQVQAKCEQEGVNLVLYAHASVGVLHARPELDLHLEEDIAKMRRISEYAFKLCVEYGGAWAGEHGDGLVRGEFIPRFFGAQVLQAFRDVKAQWDPMNLMNPGKLLDSPPLTENMRYQVPGYLETAEKAEAKAWFQFREQGGLRLAVEQCNGVGACRKLNSGVMCPSFMATRNEKDSTRARANALRLAITGQLESDPEAAMASEEVGDVLELCLGCKACKKECPNAVDVAKMKAEVLQKQHEQHGLPLGHRLIGDMPVMAPRLAGPLAPMINRIQSSAPVRSWLEKVAGIDRRRPLPAFASRSLKQRLGDALHVGSGERGEVGLYVDSYTDAYEPWVGEAAINLLAGCGYRVRPLFAGDSQRARISKGMLEAARKGGAKLLCALKEQAPGDLPILCIEPSCASALKEDLPDLVQDIPLGQDISRRVWMVEEYLFAQGVKLKAPAGKILIHGHCHQKAVLGVDGLKGLLPAAELIDAGCCGMAGAFGYEHRDLSFQVGEDRLFPRLRKMDPGTTVVANGFSCRHQVADALGVEAKHIVEVLEPADG